MEVGGCNNIHCQQRNGRWRDGSEGCHGWLKMVGCDGRCAGRRCVNEREVVVKKIWLRLKFVSVFYYGWCFVSEINTRN
jgi:hypothetical protein